MTIHSMLIRYGAVLATIAAAGLFSALPTHAQDAASVENLGLYGGEVRDIAVDPTSDYVYISTYSPNGFFISSDNGLTWSGMPDGTDYGEPRGVEVTSDGTFYMLNNEGLLKSTDHGVTETSIGDVGAYAATFTTSGDMIVVGRTDGSIQVSTDAGSTWTTTAVVDSTSVISSISIGADSAIYAMTSDGSSSALFTSTDDGATWNEIDMSSTGIVGSGVLALPSDSSFLLITPNSTSSHPFVSHDGGASWTDTGLTGYQTTTPTADSAGRIYIGNSYSDDNGDSWSSMNDTTPSSRVSGEIVADPDDVTHLFGATFGAMAISTDQGDTWADSNTGITAVTVKDIAQSTDKTVVWAATNAGLAKTTNFTDESGATWEFPIHYEYYPESVWVDPEDSNHVVVGGYTDIYVTTDGGDSWTTATGWESTFAVKQLIQDSSTGTLYAAGAYQNFTDFKTGGVYQSVDGGLTWTSMDFFEGAVQSLVIGADDVLYAGAGNIDLNADSLIGIYKYVDGSWIDLESSPNMEITALGVDPADTTHMFATAADFNTTGSDSDTVSGFYVSEDAGDTWTRVTSGLSDATKFRSMTVQASTEGATRVYLGGTNKLTNAGTIYKSIDAGASFGVYYTGLASESIYAFLFDGLLTGKSTGAYGMQTRVRMKVQKHAITVDGIDKMRIRATLRDKATHQVLAHERVVLYRRVHGVWTLVKAKRTSLSGRVNFKVRPHAKARFKVVFEPTGTSAEEYTSVFKTTRVHAF